MVLGAFGVGVHGDRAVVGGQDHPQGVGGGVFVAPAHLVHLGGVEQVAVLVVGFTGRSAVDVDVVAFATARHRDVCHGAAGCVGGDALGGVHGGGIAQGDVLAHVVVFEDGAGLVGEPFGGDASGGGI